MTVSIRLGHSLNWFILKKKSHKIRNTVSSAYQEMTPLSDTIQTIQVIANLPTRVLFSRFAVLLSIGVYG